MRVKPLRRASALVRSPLRMWSLTVRIDSAPGKGSQFALTVPLAQTKAAGHSQKTGDTHA